MEKKEYVDKLKKRLQLDDDKLFVNGEGTITLVTEDRYTQGCFTFVYARRSDFTEENLENDEKFLSKCIRCFEEGCKKMRMELKLIDIEEDF